MKFAKQVEIEINITPFELFEKIHNQYLCGNPDGRGSISRDYDFLTPKEREVYNAFNTVRSFLYNNRI